MPCTCVRTCVRAGECARVRMMGEGGGMSGMSAFFSAVSASESVVSFRLQSAHIRIQGANNAQC